LQDPEKFESLEEKTVDELGISKAELIKRVHEQLLAIQTQQFQLIQKSNHGKVPASERDQNIRPRDGMIFIIDHHGSPSRLEEALRPIIEKMLNEHYNH
jgi:hypothetical protein